jgi:NitT/TauT family transport system substrate-binding protein
VLAVVVLALVGVGAAAGPASSTVRRSEPSGTLTLGYYDNVTHAPALVGLQGGLFTSALGPNVQLKTQIFNAGPAEVQAILSGSIDAGYIGPNPTVTAFEQSHGAVTVISGAASGGAFLVVKPAINGPKDLKGKTVASPQLGNTQDVALRSWLKKHGLKTDTAGGGDVSIRPQDNAVTLQAFEQNLIQGAWVPEPWATRLVKEGGGKILVDERTLWPKGRYVTTDLVVRTDYLKAHPDLVQRLLEGQVAAVDLIAQDPTRAQQLVGQRIQADTGKPLAASLIAASFGDILFTNDPIVSSLVASAKTAVDLHLPGAVVITKGDLGRLYTLKPLNAVLVAKHEPTVSAS